MRGAFLVYAIAALVLAAGIGPAIQTLKDSTLEDLSDLKRPHPLSDFPFIKTFQDHLPPIVVDWLVVDASENVKVPPGATVKFDRDGRLIIIWPDGCSERVNDPDHPTREECQETEPPPPPEPTPCPGDLGYNNSTMPPSGCPPPDIKCASGYHVEWDTTSGEYVCRLEPACQTDDIEARPSYCPPPPPPEPECAADEVMAEDGTCLPKAEHGLMTTHRVTDPGSSTATFQLKAPYAGLKIRFASQGQPSPSYTIEVERVSDGTDVCFEEGGARTCQFNNSLFGAGTVTASTDPADAPFATGAYVVRVDFDETVIGGEGSLTIDMFGTVQA